MIRSTRPPRPRMEQTAPAGLGHHGVLPAGKRTTEGPAARAVGSLSRPRGDHSRPRSVRPHVSRSRADRRSRRRGRAAFTARRVPDKPVAPLAPTTYFPVAGSLKAALGSLRKDHCPQGIVVRIHPLRGLSRGTGVTDCVLGKYGVRYLGFESISLHLHSRQTEAVSGSAEALAISVG